MRKVILFICAIFFCTLVSAQDFSLRNNEFIITDTLPQSEHWDNANRWVSLTFEKARYALDYADKENGRMIIKFNFIENLNRTYNLTYKYSLQIDCRDNKYRATFSSIGIFATDPETVIYSKDSEYELADIRVSEKELEMAGIPLNAPEQPLSVFLQREKSLPTDTQGKCSKIYALCTDKVNLEIKIDSLKNKKGEMHWLDKRKVNNLIEDIDDKINEIDNQIEDIVNLNKTAITQQLLFNTIKRDVVKHKGIIIKSLEKEMGYKDNF